MFETIELARKRLILSENVRLFRAIKACNVNRTISATVQSCWLQSPRIRLLNCPTPSWLMTMSGTCSATCTTPASHLFSVVNWTTGVRIIEDCLYKLSLNTPPTTVDGSSESVKYCIQSRFCWQTGQTFSFFCLVQA